MLEINDGYWKLDGKDMPIVTQSAHIGIQKAETNSIVWISKGLFAINATSSTQVGAQQFIFPILPPSPELLNMSRSGFTYTLQRSALRASLVSLLINSK
jgi:hypothetical protein